MYTERNKRRRNEGIGGRNGGEERGERDKLGNGGKEMRMLIWVMVGDGGARRAMQQLTDKTIVGFQQGVLRHSLEGGYGRGLFHFEG